MTAANAITTDHFPPGVEVMTPEGPGYVCGSHSKQVHVNLYGKDDTTNHYHEGEWNHETHSFFDPQDVTFLRDALEGAVVDIYEDPITQESLEGQATITKVVKLDTENATPQMVHAQVQFDEEGENYYRRFRLDQLT